MCDETKILCSVCQECIHAEDATSSLPCGHVFHSTCLVPWLWREQSCPNCRHTAFADPAEHNVTDADAIDVTTTLSDIIQELRTVRLERTRIFRRNMRRARLSDAPRELINHVRRRKNMEEAMNKSRILVIEHTKRVQNHERSLQAQFNELHRKYRSEISRTRALGRERARDDIKNLHRARQNYRRQRISFMNLDDDLRARIY